jgi:4-carboxymuconolactone decarboxylase
VRNARPDPTARRPYPLREKGMSDSPKPPKAYEDFVRQFPRLADAWGKLSEAGQDGPLKEDTARLVKLAVAIGALREGAVRSNLRKAFAAGIPPRQIDQVIALAASTIGLPATVAVYTWIQDERQKQ